SGPSGGTRAYHHPDHLSVRLVTEGTPGRPTPGEGVGEGGHFPFGEAWYPTGTGTKRFFSRYSRDGETGLDYAVRRFYNSPVTAFCSADPVQGSVDDPQSWNRYAYVENDPINLTDPSGESLLGWILNIVTLGLNNLFGGGGDFITRPGGENPGFNRDLLI